MWLFIDSLVFQMLWNVLVWIQTYSYLCGSIIYYIYVDRECDTVAMCRWCDRDVKGSEVNPYCGEYAECYFGQIGHPSPYAGL